MTIELTKSQAENLLDFIECEFIPFVRNDPNIDSMQYLSDICDIYKQLNIKIGEQLMTKKGGEE